MSKYRAVMLVIDMKKRDLINNLQVVNATAILRRVGSGMRKSVVDFRAEVVETIAETMVRHVFFRCSVSMIYYVPNLAGNYEKAFYNRTINFCTYLRQPFTDRILKMIYDHLSQRGNLPKRCPIATGTYTFNTSLEGVHLPGFFPESRFRLDVNFQRTRPRNDLIFRSRWFGELRRDS
uniref:Uncharacterized protein n=1 Tax=Anopheles christyi TaxID=43041 RepID=A0A182K6Q0_9DIPT